MKLKNIFKSFAIFAFIIPCMFSFIACGGQNEKVEVNIEGDYIETTKEDAKQAYNNAKNQGGIFNGFRFEGDYSSVLLGTSISNSSKASGNGIVKDENPLIEMKSKETVNSGGYEVNVNIQYYYKNNMIYTKYADGRKIATEVNEIPLIGLSSYTIIDVMRCAFDESFIFDGYNKTEFFKFEENNTVKYKLVTNLDSENYTEKLDMTCYIVLENNAFYY